ncbi:hypothetical protein AB5J72_21285 [Streptomyces sp. CG1]
METLHLVLNAVTVIFIAATMFAAGLGPPYRRCAVSSQTSRSYCWR